MQVNFTSDIAKEIGMKVARSGVIDLILGYMSNNYKLYHEMPEGNDKESLATIMDGLQVAAMKFKAKNQEMQFLFIDRIDVLAKKERRAG